MTSKALLLALAALPLVACSGGDDGGGKPFTGTGATGGSATGGASGGGGTSGDGGTGAVAGGGAGGGGGSGNSGGGGTGNSGGGGTGNSGGGGTGGGGGSGGGTTGPEQCSDNFDNDGDGKTDCADPDCAAACASACAAPTALADPADTQGTTAGHPDSLNNSCSGSGSGPDVAYEVTAAKSGVFEAVWGGFSPLSISIRSACSGAELGCTKTKSLKVPVSAGTKLWVVLDGVSGGSGPFGLSVQSRPIVCGDKHTDGTEACDDGNTTSGDGCSSTCTLEIKETEPNDTAAQANTWVSPFTATISSASDVDIVKVTVTKAGGSLSASVVDFGDGACEQDKIDSTLELWAPDANTVLATDDNSGEGLCSAVSKSNLTPGTYYLVVGAAPGANPATFSYKLNVSLN